MITGQNLVDLARQCGAVWAGIEPLALHRDRNAVSCSFSSEFEAEEFTYFVRNFVDYKITRDQDFVLIWL